MSRWVSVLLALLAPLAVAAGAWVTFVHEPEVTGSSLVPLMANPAPLPEVEGEAEAAPQPTAPEPAAPELPDEGVTAATGLDVSLAGVNAFDVALKRPPRAGLVFDVATGEVLWSLRPRRTLSIASLTKIMTALLAVEGTRPREPVRITRAALNYSGSGIGMLPKDRRVQFETLLNGLLIVSGNDAAIALAVHLAGSEVAFVRRMNERASEWGLECTRFASSHGLEAGNRSCARDLAVMTRLAMRRARIRRIARTEYADLPLPVKGGRLYLSGHNPLQRLDYPGAIGLKTGYTNEAGRCFVGVARRDGRTLGVVLLNSRDPSLQAPKLLDAAFAAG
jgi:serine-type D-Ala-D-Ala carboxypeptidase (penicillin-binding protein 5/6)